MSEVTKLDKIRNEETTKVEESQRKSNGEGVENDLREDGWTKCRMICYCTCQNELLFGEFHYELQAITTLH